MIRAAWQWLSALAPVQWLKNVALFVLAAWGIWTAWRALDRGANARSAGALAESEVQARVAHAKADELHARAERKRAQAQARIDAVRRAGNESMAAKLEKMNAL